MNRLAAGEAIEAGQGSHAHPVAARDRPQRIAGPHHLEPHLAVVLDRRPGEEPQPLARPQDVMRGDAVHARERDRVHAIAAGDAPQRITAAHDLELHVGAAPAGAAVDPRGGEHARSPAAVGVAGTSRSSPDGEPSVGSVLSLRRIATLVLNCRATRVDRIAAADLVVLEAHALIGGELGDVLLEDRRRIDRQEQVERPGGVGGPAVEGGIEVVNLVRP